MERSKITKEDKSALFCRMWAIANALCLKFGTGNAREYLSPALKIAWQELKSEKGLPETAPKSEKVRKVAAGHYAIVKNFHKWEIIKTGRVWAIVHRGVKQGTFKTKKEAVEMVFAAA